MRASKKKVRLTVDLSPQFHERLEALESLVGADSKADLIRDALRLYEFVCRRVIQEGAKFRAVSKSGEVETLVLLE